MKRSRFQSLFLALIAISLLASCGADGNQMREQLAQLEEQNRSGKQMLNDSLAEQLVDYFDRHGSANERMRARYMLGRTYFDLGELPRALETYYTARDCADTTAADCDYRTLSRIHAQSAHIFSHQLQPRSQLSELILAIRDAWKGGDTLTAIACRAMMADVYDPLEAPDSVIRVIEDASSQYKHVGRIDLAAQIGASAITPLVLRGEISRAHDFISDYESYSGFVDSDGNVEQGREIFYYIKGKYYLAIDQLDSAEYLFRKELRYATGLNDRIAASKGLLMLYSRRGNPDSIALYSSIAYELNDSAYSLSEMEYLQNVQASYNYNRSKLLAEKKSRETEKMKSAIVIILLIVLTMTAFIAYLFAIYRKKKELQIQRYINELDNLDKARAELEDLRHDNLISASLIGKKNEEILLLQRNVLEYQKQLEKSWRGIREERIVKSPIVTLLRGYAEAIVPKAASADELKELQKLIASEVPDFDSVIMTSSYTPTPMEYDVCLLIRAHFPPSAIARLLKITNGYAANIRRRLLLRMFGVTGSPASFDKKILSIGL